MTFTSWLQSIFSKIVVTTETTQDSYIQTDPNVYDLKQFRNARVIRVAETASGVPANDYYDIVPNRNTQLIIYGATVFNSLRAAIGYASIQTNTATAGMVTRRDTAPASGAGANCLTGMALPLVIEYPMVVRLDCANAVAGDLITYCALVKEVIL